LPDGKRRRLLAERFEHFVARGFEQRLLSFDDRAAHEYAEVMGHRKEIGRPLSISDGQIASVARANHLAVATRNVRDFEECGLELINPFAAG
jgi:predicted nucleic acid-binding protein